MKFLLLLVATAALAHDDERQMFKTWAKKKALESCWGEDNMKTYTVNMKKAVAKCTQQDAPELELPIFRSMDKFVNVLVSFAHEKQEDNMEEMVQMMKMMQIMNKYKQSHHDSHDYSSYSGYNKKSDSFAPIMEYMMKNKMDHHQSYNNEYAMKDESQPWMEKMKMMMLMKKMMSGEQDMRRENPFEDMMTSRSDYGSMQSRSDPEHDMDMGMFQKMMKFMTNMPVRPARDNMDNKYQKMASLMHHFVSLIFFRFLIELSCAEKQEADRPPGRRARSQRPSEGEDPSCRRRGQGKGWKHDLCSARDELPGRGQQHRHPCHEGGHEAVQPAQPVVLRQV